MALNARKVASTSNSGSAQDPIEVGSYPCRIVQIIDCGLQTQRAYQGKEKAPAYEIMMTYEFTDEFCLDDDDEEDTSKPRWLSETFPFHSLDMDLAKSTKRYKALDPKEVHEGDFTALIDMPCTVTVVQNDGKGKNAGKVYNNISAVSAMRSKDAANVADLVNEPKVFVLDDPDLTIFNSLPQWLQDKLKDNLEFGGSELEKALTGTPKKPKAKAKPAAETAADDSDDEEW